MAGVPFLLPLLGLLAGMAAAFCGAGAVVGAAVTAVSLAIAFILSNYRNKATEALRLRRYHIIWIFLLTAGIGIIATDFRRPEEVSEKILSESVALSGEALDVTTTAYGDRIVIKTDRIFLPDGKFLNIANCKAVATVKPSEVIPGDIVSIKGRLRKVGENANRRDNGYDRYLLRRGIVFSLWNEREKAEVLESSGSLHSISRRLRDGIVKEIELSGLERPTVNFLVTVLTGDRDFLNDGTRTIFSDAGVSHALALSGMHIGIIISILMVLFFPLNIIGKYKLRLLLTLLAVWFYTFITGMPPSAVRASIMASFLFVSVVIERENSVFNSLFGAAFIILLIDPYSIFDVGLQLSFCCVGLIASFAGPLNPLKRHLHPKGYAVLSFILTTLAASIGIWAITAYYFKSVPLLVLPANIVMLPLLPFYLSIAIFYLLFASLGIRIGIIGNALDSLYDSLVGFLEFLSGEGSSSLDMEITGLTVILWLLTVVLAALYVNRKVNGRKFIAMPAISGILAIMSMLFIPVEAEADEMIFQKRYDRVSFVVYEGKKERRVEPPANCITSHDCLKRVVTVDSPIPDSLVMDCDYLIVARGFKGNFEELRTHFNPRVVITHPSLFRKRENNFIESATQRGVHVHSLRENGPLRVAASSEDI